MPAKVTAARVGDSSDGDVEVTLSSDAVALFVSVEAEAAPPGRWNASALLLLPWQTQTVAFRPLEVASEDDAGAEGTVEAGGGSSSSGAGDILELEVTVYWLQSAMEVLQQQAEATSYGPSSAATRAGSVCGGGSGNSLHFILLLYLVGMAFLVA